MRLVTLVLWMVLVLALLTLRGQEAVDERAAPNDSRSQTSEASPSPAVPELSQLDEAFKRSSLGKEADEARMHLEWRQLANRMSNDPEVIQAKESANAARTDLEKRERLRDYYNVYYGKMRALASTEQMKHALDLVKQDHLSHINQPRVRHETDAGLPTPTPRPRSRHK